jgi:hypothetical protein
MLHRLCVIVFALLLSCSAHAQRWYAAPDGDDTNDCLTVRTACKTAQAVAQKMPLGGNVLQLAPGVYDETVDVSHGRQVFISGPMGAEGSCPDMNAVRVRQFLVQDNATIWVWCLSTGQVACRQWSIADVVNVRFFGMDQALVATETTAGEFHGSKSARPHRGSQAAHMANIESSPATKRPELPKKG